MNQFEIPFHLHAALARNPGAEVTTHLAPYERRHGHYTVAQITLADGNLLKRASAPSEQMAITNLNTALSLG